MSDPIEPKRRFSFRLSGRRLEMRNASPRDSVLPTPVADQPGLFLGRLDEPDGAEDLIVASDDRIELPAGRLGEIARIFLQES